MCILNETMIFLVLWVFMTLRLSCYWPRS